MTDPIQIIKDFVEGKITHSEFEQQLYTNPALETALSNSTINWSGTYLQNTTAFLFLTEQNYHTSAGRLNAHATVELFLKKIGVAFTASKQYADADDLLAGASPKYIDAAPSFIEKHILPVDGTLSIAEQKRLIKQRYAELFRYQTKPPKWIQHPRWPIMGNKPLFFLGQVEIKKSMLFHDDGYVYLFVDIETGAMETVKQFY